MLFSLPVPSCPQPNSGPCRSYADGAVLLSTRSVPRRLRLELAPTDPFPRPRRDCRRLHWRPAHFPSPRLVSLGQHGFPIASYLSEQHVKIHLTMKNGKGQVKSCVQFNDNLFPTRQQVAAVQHACLTKPGHGGIPCHQVLNRFPTKSLYLKLACAE
jgi:hypothetical protein